MPKFVRAWCVVILLFFISTPLMATYFQWDPAGSGTRLKDLNVNRTDDKTEPSQYLTDYEHYKLDGFLGRLLYQGEANTITVTNSGPNASGGDATKFYYTKLGDTNRWRRIFFVFTIKGLLHNPNLPSGQREVLVSTNNALIVSDGESFTIPGAGPDQLDPSHSSYSGGYDINGNWGSGSTFIYKYRYQYIWMDMTAVRANESKGLSANYGCYESIVTLQGNGLSSLLYLIGYRSFLGLPAYQTEPYSFSVERTCEECIPFSQLVLKDSSMNAYPVGIVRYNSSDLRVNVTFASNIEGNAVDFKFSSGSHSFPYSLVFKPITPTGNTEIIVDANRRFGSTDKKVKFTSPTHGDSADKYIMIGELLIFVAPTLKYVTLPASNYTSTIYCHLKSW